MILISLQRKAKQNGLNSFPIHKSKGVNQNTNSKYVQRQ